MKKEQREKVRKFHERGDVKLLMDKKKRYIRNHSSAGEARCVRELMSLWEKVA